MSMINNLRIQATNIGVRVNAAKAKLHNAESAIVEMKESGVDTKRNVTLDTIHRLVSEAQDILGEL